MLASAIRYGRGLPLLVPAALFLIFLHLHNTGLGRQTPLSLFSTEADNALNITRSSVNVSANSTDTDIRAPSIQAEHVVETPAPCHPLPDIENVLVVLKTGITEALEKVPAHINTTLRCIPHKLIVSDFEEAFDGIRTHNVLRNASGSLLANDDFALYNRAQAGGRAALIAQDFTKVANSAAGMLDNPGWRLDKWKFLPMIQEARSYRPDAQWYFFYEADTYPEWPNLLAWLRQFDPEQKLYLGSPVMVGDSIFAHGGSGFVISHAAMHAVTDYHAGQLEEWNQITESEWAGDCVLGRALQEVDVPLTSAWPHFHGWSVWELDALTEVWGSNNWCIPPIAFHHMTPDDIGRMWSFDQEWYNETNTVMTFADIFTNLVYPLLADKLDNWDNFADAENIRFQDPGSSNLITIHECAEFCAQNSQCLQYRLDSAGKCKTSTHAYGGIPSSGVQSGTMMWRVEALIEERGKCQTPKWVY